MTDTAQLLEAGALVPLDVEVPTGIPVDRVDARIYAHPCLPGRRVVRLVPDALAAGVDAEMALADFVLAEHRDDIALQRRRSLGFPGAVLVRDPDRAAYAVQVHRELLTHAKKIATKPGHAKEGIDALAARLGREVPSFLPSFWEEAARAYATGGNLQYAASAFERARASEREFGLAVDEARRDEAYLEFALLGALAVKSLQSYAKDVSSSSGPADAYERFFAIAVKRTLGGLPPWASVAKDLRAAARAAKRDLAAEDERFLREVLGASSITKASQSFFTDYTPALRRLAAAVPAVHARLLDLFPAFAGGQGWRDEDHASDWLQILFETGSLAILTTPDVPAAALPAGGRAGWLARAQGWIHRHNGALVQIASGMVAALQADGKPVQVASHGWRHPLDVDLLDLLLERGVAVTLPGGDDEDDDAAGSSVDLDDWATRKPLDARWGLDAITLPRDFTHAAAWEPLAKVLPGAVGAACGRQTFDEAARGRSALTELRRQWFLDLVKPSDGGLPALTELVERAEDKVRVSVLEEFPELRERIGAIDPVGALVYSLRGGIPAELGWPALDAARAELAGQDEEAKVHVAFPWVFVFNDLRVIVLGPQGRLLEHDLKLPKGFDRRVFTWADDLLVFGMGWQSGWKGVGYWASRPADTFELEAGWGQWDARIQAVLPDGRRFEGGVPFRAGDRFKPEHAQVWADAEGVWCAHPEQPAQLARVDTTTGKPGEAGRPAFLADTVDGELSTSVLHAQPYAGSLLGNQGWYGFKVVEGSVGVCTDGRRSEGAVEGRVPDALVRWPGDDRLRFIDKESHGVSSDIQIRHPDDLGVASKAEVSEEGFLPLIAWHALSARDVAGSAALRRLEADAARQLMEAGAEDEQVDAAIGRVLPEITDAALRAGVREAVKSAVDVRDRLARLLGGETEEEDGEAPGVRDQAAKEALSGLCETWGYDDLEAFLRSYGQALFGEGSGKLYETDLDVGMWIGAARALAICAVRPVDAERRSDARAILRAWAEAGWADGRPLRKVAATAKKIPSWAPKITEYGETRPAERFALQVGETRCVVECDGWDETDGGDFVLWQSARSGTFELPAEVEIGHITDLSRPAERAWLEAFLAEERTWTPTAEDAAALAAATGRSVAEAKLLLIGLYGVDDYGSDFLGKELREVLGLKTTDAKVAKQGLPAMSREERVALYAQAMPEDPALLGVAGPDDPAGFVQRLGAAWRAKHGARKPLPEEVLRASKELDGDARELLDLLTLSDPGAKVGDPGYALDGDGDLMAAHGEVLGEDALLALPKLVAFVCEHTTADHELRAGLTRLVSRVRAVLADPAVVLPAVVEWHYSDGKAAKAAKAWFEAVDVAAQVVFEPEDPNTVKGRHKDDGVVVTWSDEQKLVVGVRLARLDAARVENLRKLLKALDNTSPLLEVWTWLRDADVASWLDGLGAGAGWEQDPRVSAPAAVAALTETGLSSDAATLLLQTLALVSPSKKAVCAWNGWKPKAYDTAAAALVEAGLVVAARRSGAGREHFLAGPWDDELGTEAWKSRWFQADLDGVPRQAVGRRFGLAAERWLAGDRPAFSGGKR